MRKTKSGAYAPPKSFAPEIAAAKSDFG